MAPAVPRMALMFASRSSTTLLARSAASGRLISRRVTGPRGLDLEDIWHRMVPPWGIGATRCRSGRPARTYVPASAARPGACWRATR
jgi:hypothetical protein